MRIAWSAWAIADREAIFDWISAESPRAAILVDERISAAIGALAQFPESGRPGRVAGTRELVIGRTLYIAAYALMARRSGQRVYRNDRRRDHTRSGRLRRP